MKPASARRTSSRLLPVPLPCGTELVSVGGGVTRGVAVAASTAPGIATSREAEAGAVWSLTMEATFVSGWASASAPVRTTTL
jgi:hypothetical protein